MAIEIQRLSLIVSTTIIIGCCSSVLASNAPKWQGWYQAGLDAFAANNYGLAEKNFLFAYDEAQKFGPNDLRLAKTMKELANLYCVRGQFPKAETWLERELRIKEKALGSENSEVIALVANLDRFYLLHGKLDKGDRLAKLMDKYADKVLQENSIEKSRANSTQYLELAANLDSLGHIYKGKGKWAEAQSFYEKAMKLRERGLPAQHMAQVSSNDNLADLYEKQGKHKEAQIYYTKALNLAEKILDPKRSEVISHMNSLAKVDISLGHYKEAEALYKRALTMLEKSKGTKSGLIGTCSFELASLYIKQGKFASAEPLLKRALLIAEAGNGPSHYSLLPIIDNYAGVLEKIRHMNEANKMRARLRSISGF
jgi:tetratricopeptide (TPR) repeat protein